MVFCIIGFVVFGILGIFSAKYRAYFWETVHCVSRQVTLRPCDTDFNEKMKSKISARMLKAHPKLGQFVFKNFAAISWVFLVVMIISFALAAQGIYNLAVYGTCDPYTGNCIFNPGYITNGSSSLGGSQILASQGNFTSCNFTSMPGR